MFLFELFITAAEVVGLGNFGTTVEAFVLVKFNLFAIYVAKIVEAIV